jgi:hypothetical protein
MPLLFEKVGGHCGVNSPAQSDDDTLFGHGPILGGRPEAGLLVRIHASTGREILGFLRKVRVQRDWSAGIIS